MTWIDAMMTPRIATGSDTARPTRRTRRGRGTGSVRKTIDDRLVTLEKPPCTAHEIGIRPNAIDLGGQRIDDQLVHARAMHASDRLSLVGKVIGEPHRRLPCHATTISRHHGRPSPQWTRVRTDQDGKERDGTGTSKLRTTTRAASELSSAGSPARMAVRSWVKPILRRRSNLPSSVVVWTTRRRRRAPGPLR